MTPRFNLKPTEHLDAPSDKLELNRKLFDEVAPKYDFITKALSLGRDSAWKRALIRMLPEKRNASCLDLACGTGDLTRLLGARFPDAKVEGLDLTPGMLEIARDRTADQRILFVQGNMNELPYSEESIDIVTGSYALRNTPELGHTLEEIYRILKPGGIAAFLDFSKPKNKIGQGITHGLLKFWGGFWGILLHRNADVYGYIADSLKRFPDRPSIRRLLTERQLKLIQSKKCFGGILEILIVEK